MPITLTEGPATGLADADLATVLEVWQSATDRLQQTHEALRAEVRRLSDELEVKNRELARENRLADLGRIASHVAHEVRNSLMPLTLYASSLRRRLSHDTLGLEALDKMEAALTALEAMVHDMLHFAADRPPRRQHLDAGEIVRKACDSLGPQFAAHGIRLSIDAPPMALWADPNMLHRALLNLLLNAVDVMPRGGEICVTACETSRGVEIEIADSGPGVDAEIRQKLFEPFFTTKSGGAGLGLAIVQRIAQSHGGDVTVQNCPEGGAAFTLRFPRQAQRAAA